MINLKHIKTTDGIVPIINRTLEVLTGDKTNKSFVIVETKIGKWISFFMDELDNALYSGSDLKVAYHDNHIDAIKFRA